MVDTHYIIFSISFALQSLDYRGIRLRSVRQGRVPSVTNSSSPPRSPQPHGRGNFFSRQHLSYVFEQYGQSGTSQRASQSLRA
jgi:hypothetical protein